MDITQVCVIWLMDTGIPSKELEGFVVQSITAYMPFLTLVCAFI